MESIRVVLAHLPGLLRGILRSAAANIPDVIISGEVTDLSMAAQLVLEADPHAIIVGAADGAIPKPAPGCLRFTHTSRWLSLRPTGARSCSTHLATPLRRFGIPVPPESCATIRGAVHAQAPPTQ